MELTLAARRQITKAQVERYRNGTKAEKSVVLDAVCGVTGWHRDHARKAMRQALAGQHERPRATRAPQYVYGPQVIAALVTCWAVLGGPSGKRLQPALPELVAALAGHDELAVDQDVTAGLLAMSAATMDRRLRPYRTGLIAGKARSMTRPGSLLKSSIPLKTWHEWDDTTPGFIEIDLVSHDGGDNNGHFFHTLDATDVATGWTEAITVRSKGERIVSAALDQLRIRFPFAILGIHSDNGSEFINHHLLKWCTDRQITFTRGRPNHKNDQAHVEQKNWTEVRHSAGYYRYDTPHELDLLNTMWPTQSRLHNLFLPQQKLQTKTRVGAKVTKTYDTAATPLTRLTRDHPHVLDPIDHRELTDLRATANPAQLRRDIDLIQANLLELARRRGITATRRKANATYLNRTKMKTPTTR
ncbi:transposase family protein, partial [Fodinibacter luteus]|uniref:integrase catalytic domain-containing protein n=1 Tax=Fodinibacter luteus TaxID=552064 RepID=UPI0031EF600E